MQEDFYINLIYKQLSKELSSEEVEILAKWEQEPGNKVIAASVRKAWEASDLLQPKIEVDLDDAFAELEGFMDEEETEKSKEKQIEPRVVPIKKRSNRVWLNIAASLALLVVSVFLLRDKLFPENLEWTQVNSLNQNTRIELADGSLVTLNKNSQLEFPQTFGRKERRVILDGEGFFEVESDAKKPFRVELPNETVTVLGTSFNIRMENGNTLVYVAEGQVAVTQSTTNKEVILGVGEAAQSSSKGLNKVQLSENDIAWKTQRLVFQEASMEDAIAAINNLYEVDLKIENTTFKSCGLTLTLDQEPLEVFFEVLRKIYKVQIEQVDEKTYLLKAGNCNLG
ncbi:MAG: FecR domain-containing protein [Bacteroidota bacterium]